MTAVKLGSWTPADPEWHEARRTRVGGSEIGVVMGWSPFQTRADLLAAKRGSVQQKESRAMKRGQILEPAVAAWLADDLGITYDDHYRGTWVDGAYLYNPDAVTTDELLCEFKTTAVRDIDHGWGRAGTWQVPLTYAAQVQWGLGVLGLTEAVLAVLSGAPKFDFAKYRIKFNPASFAYLKAQADIFLTELAESEQAA